MAYDRRAQLPLYRLRFEDFPGLTVMVRPPSLDGLLAVAEAEPVLRRASRSPDDVAVFRAWRKICGAIAGSLVSWDLLAEGEPVPATRGGLMAQDFEFVMAIADAWRTATTPGAGRRVDLPGESVDEALDDPATSPRTEVNPLSGLTADGIDPETGVDEEYLTQFPVATGPSPELVTAGV